MGETDGFDRAPNIQSIKDFQASNASEEDTYREACGHGNQSLGWESHFSRVWREPAAGSIGNAIGVDVERDRNSESIGDTHIHGGHPEPVAPHDDRQCLAIAVHCGE